MHMLLDDIVQYIGYSKDWTRVILWASILYFTYLHLVTLVTD
jgi:hypothetical protein